MNKVFLIGRLGKDPELSQTANGVSLCKFSLATTRPFASKDGSRETDWHNITVWRGSAETCAKYLKRGSMAAVAGTIQYRSYEDKNGVKRTVTDIIADEVEFLSPKQEPKAEVPNTQIRETEQGGFNDISLPF